MKPSDLFLRSQCRALTGCHVQSRSPANFQNPDCPETRRFPSGMMDFYTFMSTIDRIIPVYTYSLRKKFLTFKGWKKYGNAKVYQSGKCPRKTLKMENSATQFIINRASTTAM